MIELNNETQVQQHLNMTLTDIWEEFLWITHFPPYNIVRCTTVNIPVKSTGKHETVMVSFSLIFELKHTQHFNFSCMLI